MVADLRDKTGLLAAIRVVVRQLFPRWEFAGDCEYFVVSQSGEFIAAKPVDTTRGFPVLPRVPFRMGGGHAVELAKDTRVLIRFVDCDEGRPYVAAVVGADDAGFLPKTLRLDATDQAQLGENASVVKLSTGEQFIALENLVKAEIQAQRAWAANHTHGNGNNGDPTTGPVAPPPNVNDVKATKSKAT